MTAPTTRRSLALGLALALLAAACSSGSEGRATGATTAPTTAPGPVVTARFPGADWETGDPAEAGIDPTALAEVAEFLATQNSNCMAVVRDGRIVAEEYWNGTGPDTDQEIFSASKSVTSTLVGIAQEQGFLDLDEPASTYITEWQGTPSETVTIRNLVSNDSGRYWDFATDYQEMAIRQPDKTAFAIGLDQQHPPGTHWEYNNSAIQTLEAVLERATGQDMAEFAQANLFEPIGMDVEIRRDPAGNPLAFMGVQASCRDLARFGWLFLQQGNWDGEQVVPAEWVAEATSPSQELNSAYGFLWWLNDDGPIQLPGRPARSGPIWPSLPTTAYAALGLGGQIVVVLPDEGIVLVREGGPQGEVQDQGNVVEEAGRRLLAGVTS